MVALLALLLAGNAEAQSPDDRWRTVRTEHFRVHYPEEAEAWALDAASRLDGIREQLTEEIGFAPTRTVDVLVLDPYTTANGSAWPFLRYPRMVLWVTPPESDSVLSNYRSWSELLLVHEDAHLVHLLRPSRNPLMSGLDKLLGIGPVTRKAPRWVIEGYATVIEARHTGWGRPTSDFRAQLLRELARQGRMPTYDQLDGSDRYLGFSYAYLVGSAFLEWLEARGPGRLADVWARLSARQNRSFNTAFAGVFGETPQVAYARFVAETTHAALTIEEARPVTEPTLWMDLTWGTGAPTVSPDGERIAAVLRDDDDPPRLVVWATAVDEEALERREREIERMLARDPLDVAPVPPKTAPHRMLAERKHATRFPVGPRWTRDGALLFSVWTLDGEGRARPDLYVWNPDTEAERRITHQADVRDADPAPDADRAVAVQHDWGRTRLVWVDLQDGSVEPLTPWGLEVVVDGPRIAPDGRTVAWLENAGRGWAVVIRDGEGEERRIEPEEREISDLAWSPDGRRLYASVGRDGLIEIEEVLDLDGPTDRITRTHGGAFAPAPTPDGEGVFFLSYDDDGREIHLASTLPDEAFELPEVPDPLPVLPLQLAEVPPAQRDNALRPRRYGLGRTEFRPLFGGSLTVDQKAIEAGVRAGDVVGRHELLLMGSYGGEAGISGGLLAGTLRVLPVRPVLQAFVVSEGAELMDRAGAALRADYDRRWQDVAFQVALGGWVDTPLDPEDPVDVPPLGAILHAAPERGVGWATAGVAVREPRTAAVGGVLQGAAQLGRTGSDDWWRAEGTAHLWFGRTFQVSGTYTYGTSTTEWGIDRYRLGGAPTSVLPREWGVQRVYAPWAEPGELRGQDRDELRVALGAADVVQLFGERHRMGDHGLPGGGITLVGLGSSARLPATPLVRVPGSRIGAGVGCVVENPSGGWDDQPCRELSDWRGWLHINWHL